MKKPIFLTIVSLLLIVSNLYAAGDLVVNGKVRIGTGTPDYALDIGGASYLNSFKVGYGLIGGHSGNDYDYIGYNARPTATAGVYTYMGNDPASLIKFGIGGFQFLTAPSGSTGTTMTASQVMTIMNNGFVGIGTTNPGSKFDVQGGPASFSDIVGGPNTTQAFVEGWTNVSFFGSSGPQRASFGNSENWETLTADGGNVGIGMTNPSHKLDVAGDVHANSFIPPSDRRFKDNIISIESPLNKVLSMEGVTFNWKRDEFTEKNFPEGRHYGVIAQEIESILPEVVLTASDGSKSVAYMEIIPVLIEAIKEQQKEIEQLKKIVAGK